MTQIFTPLVLHLSDWWLCIDNPCQNSPNKQILYVGQAKARSWTILLDNSHCRDAARYCREIVTISRWDVFCWHNCLQKMYTHRSQELKLYQRNACRTSRKLLVFNFLDEISPNPSSFSIYFSPFYIERMENTLLSIKSIYIVLYTPSVELTFTYWILILTRSRCNRYVWREIGIGFLQPDSWLFEGFLRCHFFILLVNVDK